MRSNKIDIRSVFFSGLFAGCGSAWVFLSTLDENLFSRRDLLLGLAVGGILFLGAWGSARVGQKAGRSFQPGWKLRTVLFFLAVLLSIPVPGNLAYLQVRDLKIEALPGTGAVVFDGLNRGQTDVPHAQFLRQGDSPSGWAYQDYRFISTRQPAELTWRGRSSNQSALTFQGGPEMGTVRVTWDGRGEEYSLAAYESGPVTIPVVVPIAWTSKLVYWLVSLIFFTSGLVFLLRWVVWLPHPAPDRFYRRGFWLKYALPVFATCLFVLLVYFPGLMSGDSLVQWSQVHTLQFSDHHPVFHTLFIWLATRIWDSPAAAAAGQILYLGLVVGWGIGNLVKRGLPEAAAWLVSAWFALSPVNGLFAATLWKDIPYGISLLWLTLILVELYFSEGRWLAGWKNFSALAACLLAVSLFRHNGLPVALALSLILLAVFRKQWRWSLAVLVVVLALRGLITGPVYRALGAAPAPANYQYALVLYHLGAHVKAGDPLSEPDRALIARLLPIEAWDVSPCTSDPIVWNRALNVEPMQRHLPEYLGLAVRLFIQNPAPDLKAVLDVGSLVYSIPPVCKTYVTPLYYKPTVAPGASWIDFEVPGVAGERSLLPGLVAPLSKFYAATLSYRAVQLLNILWWRPATYLLVSLLAMLAFLGLEKKWTGLVIAAPALVQSGVLLVVNVAQEVRYQYGVYLIALYLVGLVVYLISSRAKPNP